MQPRRHIPGWLFWPVAISTLFIWLFLTAWLVLRFFGGVDVGNDPFSAFPKLFDSTQNSQNR